MTLALRDALIAFRRAPLMTLLSVTTVAFSLFAFGLFGLVALNMRAALQEVEANVEIRAFVSDGTPVEAVAAAAADVQAFPEVERARIVDKDEALERAREELGEFRDIFESGFLPMSVEIHLKPGYRDPTTVKAVAARMSSYAFVDDVRYGEEWVDKLYRIRNVAAVVGIVLGTAFAAVAMIIIGSTIRMVVLARGREISIMRLVGATDGFIRRPYLIEGFLTGVLGGTLALLLVWLANGLVSRYLVQTTFFETRHVVLGIVAGAVLGLLGSAFSVGRHLRQV